MGLFGPKHDGTVVNQYDEIITSATNSTEEDFLDRLNGFVKIIEVDDTFNTNQKLAIYELLSQLSNCLPAERAKYAKKLRKKLI